MAKNTREIKIKNINIGAENPVAVQTMLKEPITDVKASIDKINRLSLIGCDIIRAAVPDEKSASCIKTIVENTDMPFVADIHFDYRLAIKSIENGASKLRINPGNIGGDEKLREVAACLREYDIPVRIGVNGGSLEKDILKKYKRPTAEALCESAFRSIERLNRFNYDNIVVSIKSSDVVTTIQANRLFSSKYDYPLHLGVTEAGAELCGIVRSSVGIGALLIDSIGDTIRVSLTGEPEEEIEAAKEILSSCNLIRQGVRVISCPTCARCKTDTLSIVKQIKVNTCGIKIPITVAVMGCAVNGPGEAKDADMGIAFGNGIGVIFSKGERIKSVKTENAVSALCEMIRDFVKDYETSL